MIEFIILGVGGFIAFVMITLMYIHTANKTFNKQSKELKK